MLGRAPSHSLLPGGVGYSRGTSVPLSLRSLGDGRDSVIKGWNNIWHAGGGSSSMVA